MNGFVGLEIRERREGSTRLRADYSSESPRTHDFRTLPKSRSGRRGFGPCHVPDRKLRVRRGIIVTLEPVHRRGETRGRERRKYTLFSVDLPLQGVPEGRGLPRTLSCPEPVTMNSPDVRKRSQGTETPVSTDTCSPPPLPPPMTYSESMTPGTFRVPVEVDEMNK